MSLPPTLQFLICAICALLGMAFFTLLERKMLGYFQLRKGPNKVVFFGLAQPGADALKLFLKEPLRPTSANSLLFTFAPLMGLILAMFLWSLYPHTHPSFHLPMSTLLLLCLSSMNVYVILAAGWASNSKYALVGSIRGVAQTISYEVTMALILISLIIIRSSYDLSQPHVPLSSPIIMLLLPPALLWFITVLAETNRSPFDLPEGESELVSGFNVEYSSGAFAFIFMAEYMNIIILSFITSTLILPLPPKNLLSLLSLALCSLFFMATFIWARGALPRVRYDHLMSLSWKCLLPASLAWLLFSFTTTTLVFNSVGGSLQP